MTSRSSGDWRTPRLSAGDVACWVLKSARPPGELVPGWSAGTTRELTRCVRRSYRLALLRPGQPCLLWVSGRTAPGVHALGELAGDVEERRDGPAVAVRLTRLPSPVARADLLADPTARDAEVMRMPAGSNPSWLSAEQYAAVLARLGHRRPTGRRHDQVPCPGGAEPQPWTGRGTLRTSTTGPPPGPGALGPWLP